MIAQYVVQTGPPGSFVARATALGCIGVCVGDPTGGLITTFPQVAVLSTQTPPAAVPTLITDVGGVATAAAVTTAKTNMTTAETTATSNQATILANIQTRQTAILAWIAANPSGAVLTAGQTLTLAQMLNGLCKLLLQQYGNTTGT